MAELVLATFIPVFLEALFGAGFQGRVVLWNMQTKESKFFDRASPGVLIEAILAAGQNDLYLALATQPADLGARSRGTNGTVIEVPGFFADIDFAGDKPGKKNYPTDLATVLRILSSFPFPPTFIQVSGGGVHVIWAYLTSIICQSDADRQHAADIAKYLHRLLSDHFRQHGFEIDNCGDLARVYRVPLSFNHKYSPSRLVEVLECNPDARIDVAALPIISTPVAKTDHPRTRDADHDLIRQHCPYYRHMTGDGAAAASEPEWLAALSITAHCAGGREIAHQYSAPHPQYSQRETDQKFDHVERDLKPFTCEVIAETYGGDAFCASCEWRRKIKSPLILGRARVSIISEDWPDIAKGGKRLKSLPNALMACRLSEVTFEYDSFHNRMRIGGHAVEGQQGDLSDNAIAVLHSSILDEHGFDPGRGHLLDATHMLCITNPYHPIKSYLSGLHWDGQPRLETWLSTYLGADNTALNRAIGRMLLVAAIRRVLQPGVKFDTVVILEGGQGTGKSTAIEILAGKENFSDQSLFSMSEKEIMEALEGVWFYEIPELDGYSRAENSKVKAIISRTEDRERAAYARYKSSWKRQNVFIATTNEAFYLKDPTGNRRFLPVKTGAIDLERLRLDRDQLFAEASALETTGFSIVLPRELWQSAKEAQNERMQEDPWLDILGKITGTVVEGEARIHTDEIFSDQHLDIPKSQRKPHHLKQVGTTMRTLGWDGPKKLRLRGQIARGYSRPSDQPDDIEI